MPLDKVGVYHVISRCTRRSFLMGNDKSYRKSWFIDELASLLPVFAVDLLGYAVMSNHVHLVLRSRPDVAGTWSAEQVARDGMGIMPIRTGIADEKLPVTADLIQRKASEPEWVEEYRQRLSSISWLMRMVKSRVSRQANREDRCTGHFWESRFTSIPLLDWGAVVACLVYVDLNAHRAGLVTRPDQATHCSMRAHLGMTPRKVDAELSACLVPLSHCSPYDIEHQGIPERSFDASDFSQVVKATIAKRLSQDQQESFARFSAEHGFNQDLWQERMAQPGLFQSGAVGSPEQRKRYADSVGKRWIADKTGLWL